MTHSSYHTPSANYTKALATLEESLRTGQFASYSQKKKQEIWDLLCSYARQLGTKIKASIVAACLAAGLILPKSTEAQTVIFTVQSGASNPLNGVSISYSKPAFVDIDNDGDKDVFIGSRSGTIIYYKNTGTSTAPVFTLQSGASNPLSGVTSLWYAAPTFVDIDGDGDMDVFVGWEFGAINYYKNTGTSTAPVFTLQSGAANPFNGVDVGDYASPVFVDIDGDGDFDAFIGNRAGAIIYYKNTGTSSAPAFTLQSGAANPFNGVSIVAYAAPCFVDVDKNGTMDAFIGAADGTISYYKNTGTSSAPAFTAQTGAANPFNGVGVASNASPATVDINGDTKVDIFIGSLGGPISYFKNTSTVLPLQLLDFTGTPHPDYNQLQWQTADEVNTQQFALETSSNGAAFTTIATIKAMGGGNNNYSYRDKTIYNGKVYYRLKMIDIDGRFTYSNIIWVDGRQTAIVNLYPNPAREWVNISIGSSAMINTTADLYSSNGILLQKILITAPQQQINIHKLAKGVYVLKFAEGMVLSFIKN